jgi:hypothetical protein
LWRTVRTTTSRHLIISTRFESSGRHDRAIRAERRDFNGAMVGVEACSRIGTFITHPPLLSQTRVSNITVSKGRGGGENGLTRRSIVRSHTRPLYQSNRSFRRTERTSTKTLKFEDKSFQLRKQPLRVPGRARSSICGPAADYETTCKLPDDAATALGNPLFLGRFGTGARAAEARARLLSFLAFSCRNDKGALDRKGAWFLASLSRYCDGSGKGGPSPPPHGLMTAPQETDRGHSVGGCLHQTWTDRLCNAWCAPAPAALASRRHATDTNPARVRRGSRPPPPRVAAFGVCFRLQF